MKAIEVAGFAAGGAILAVILVMFSLLLFVSWLSDWTIP